MKRTRIFLIAALVMCMAFSLCACSFFREASEEIKPHLISEEEAESAPVRNVNLLTDTKGFETNTVKDQCDELIEILRTGYKPDFTRALATVKQVYNRAINMLDRYILNTFSDYEKVHAIHDWLSYEIKYDFDLLDLGNSANSSDPSFGLEGVFVRHKAVCDGFSKAFSLLCGIEGIPSTRILGSYDDQLSGSVNHSWNKVRIDEKWYNIDTTMDSFHLSTASGKFDILNHGYFLVSDSDIEDCETGRHVKTATVPENVDYDCEETYDYYANAKVGSTELSALVTSQAELNAVFDAVKASKGKMGRIELRLAFPDYDEINLERTNAYVVQIREAYGRVGSYDYVFDADGGAYPYKRYPRGVFVFLIYK